VISVIAGKNQPEMEADLLPLFSDNYNSRYCRSSMGFKLVQRKPWNTFFYAQSNNGHP
jgi:hypothetical protein